MYNACTYAIHVADNGGVNWRMAVLCGLAVEGGGELVAEKDELVWATADIDASERVCACVNGWVTGWRRSPALLVGVRVLEMIVVYVVLTI